MPQNRKKAAALVGAAVLTIVLTFVIAVCSAPDSVAYKGFSAGAGDSLSLGMFIPRQ